MNHPDFQGFCCLFMIIIFVVPKIYGPNLNPFMLAFRQTWWRCLNLTKLARKLFKTRNGYGWKDKSTAYASGLTGFSVAILHFWWKEFARWNLARNLMLNLDGPAVIFHPQPKSVKFVVRRRRRETQSSHDYDAN